MKLDTQRLQTLDQVREFLAGSRPLDLQPETRAEAYAFVAETLQRFDYSRRGKADKGLIRRFLNKVTGLSRAQVTRLLHQHRTTGAIADRRRPRHPFPRRYTKADIGLLAEVDALHGTLSGPATRKLCVRALQLFGDRRFERLAAISNGHLYNLRHSTSYQRRRGTMPAPTRPCTSPSASGAGPSPSDNPLPAGRFVHPSTASRASPPQPRRRSSSSAGERIDTPCLAPVLEALLRAFPFNVRGPQRFGRPGCKPSTSRVHQVPTPPQRQRPRREQERLGHPQAPRIRPHRYAERVNAFTQSRTSTAPVLPRREVDAKGPCKRYPHANV